MKTQEQKLQERANKLRNDYQRRYREANKERVRQWNRQYWLKKASTEASESEQAED